MARRLKRLFALVVAGGLALMASGCGDEGIDDVASGRAAGGGEAVETNLSIVSFAVPKAANNAIQAAWARTPEGRGVTWTESYGASGDQSRAVVSGLEADYVHFSLEGDVTRLVEAGLVADHWNRGPTGGIVSDSVVVLVVRDGNPKGIKGWADLVKPGIGIVTPNPGSSGSARWNVLAAYGAAFDAAGGDEAAAAAYLTKFFENVAALPGSGRDATTAFLSGTGDVLVSYENEAILARQEGEELDYVVPGTTLLIENPGAVLVDADPRAHDWLDFVLSEAGQTEFVRKGFRSPVAGFDYSGIEVAGALDPGDPFPTPAKLLTVGADFHGWSDTNKRFFDEATGIVPRIQRDTGRT